MLAIIYKEFKYWLTQAIPILSTHFLEMYSAIDVVFRTRFVEMLILKIYIFHFLVYFCNFYIK